MSDDKSSWPLEALIANAKVVEHTDATAFEKHLAENPAITVIGTVPAGTVITPELLQHMLKNSSWAFREEA